MYNSITGNHKSPLLNNYLYEPQREIAAAANGPYSTSLYVCTKAECIYHGQIDLLIARRI